VYYINNVFTLILCSALCNLPQNFGKDKKKREILLLFQKMSLSLRPLNSDKGLIR
jgi:hypothetical protein